MRKTLIIIFGVIVVLVLAAILVWNMLPSIVSRDLSKRTKVSVSIGAFGITPSSLKVDRIRMGNPPGSILKDALSIDEVKVSVPLTRFFDDNIVIDLMTMDDVYLGLEFESQRSTKGNWTTIMQNLKESTSSDKKKAQDTGKSTSVLIKKLIITDLQIELAYRSDRKVRKLRPIEKIELDNISSEGGLPTAQITDIIMSEMLKEVFSKEGLQNMLQNVLPGGDSGGGVQGVFKGLFSEMIELENDWDILYNE